MTFERSKYCQTYAMLPIEVELVSEGLSGGGGNMTFERSNVLDTALYRNIPLLKRSCKEWSNTPPKLPSLFTEIY